MKSRHLRNCELVPVAIPMNFSDLSFCESTPELPEHRWWRRESLADNHWRGAVCLSEAGETGKEERTWVLGFAARIMRRGGSHISFLCEGEVPAHWRRFSVHWGVSLPPILFPSLTLVLQQSSNKSCVLVSPNLSPLSCNLWPVTFPSSNYLFINSLPKTDHAQGIIVCFVPNQIGVFSYISCYSWQIVLISSIFYSYHIFLLCTVASTSNEIISDI